MSLEEYKKRQDAILSSSASIAIRQTALEQLEVEYSGINRRNQKILQDIYQCEAEIKGDEF